MAIEIKELHIRINVKGDNQSPESGGGNDKKVIQECLDQVMKVMKNKQER